MQEGKNIITSDLLRDPDFRAKLVESSCVPLPSAAYPRVILTTARAHSPDYAEPLGLAFTGLNFLPIQQLTSPARAAEIISSIEAKLAQGRANGSIPPGLQAQYEQQLAMLKDPAVPDVEIMVTPFSFKPGERASLVPPPAVIWLLTTGFLRVDVAAKKPIIAILSAVCRPFSRGTIVSLSDALSQAVSSFLSTFS